MFDLIAIIKKEEFNTLLLMLQLSYNKANNKVPKSVKLNNLQYPFFIRPGTEDIKTIINTVIREEYGQYKFRDAPKWMIDAGAYIGDTSAYFLSRFTNLRIIALEPHPTNYNIACINLKGYSNRVILLKKGLWKDDQNHMFDGDFTGASIQDKGFNIECISIPTILYQYKIDKIDIFKMDIEGAEKAIFASNPEEWLDKVKMIIIEIHGSDIYRLIYSKLKKNNFSIKPYRSVLYCINKCV